MHIFLILEELSFLKMEGMKCWVFVGGPETISKLTLLIFSISTEKFQSILFSLCCLAPPPTNQHSRGKFSLKNSLFNFSFPGRAPGRLSGRSRDWTSFKLNFTWKGNIGRVQTGQDFQRKQLGKLSKYNQYNLGNVFKLPDPYQNLRKV